MRPRFPTAPALQACLMQYRDRYHDCLNQEAAHAIRSALRKDLRVLHIASEEQLEALVTTTGLPASLSRDGAPPPLPFQAPFSGAMTTVRSPCMRAMRFPLRGGICFACASTATPRCSPQSSSAPAQEARHETLVRRQAALTAKGSAADQPTHACR
jgi:hypothetical protein